MKRDEGEIARLNSTTEKIIGCAYTVSNALGCGFVEKVYENALAIEIKQRLGTQAPVPVECTVPRRHSRRVSTGHVSGEFGDCGTQGSERSGRCPCSTMHQLFEGVQSSHLSSSQFWRQTRANQTFPGTRNPTMTSSSLFICVHLCPSVVESSSYDTW